jgi:tellurium resistance protein TerZ
MSIFDAIRTVVDNIEGSVNTTRQIVQNSIEQVQQQKQPKLTLVKGQRISLEKNGKSLTNVCVGVNWGMIGRTAVDLDVSCITFQGNSKDETIYYGKLNGTGIKHSGDDLVGDSNGDDGLDNEIITLDLTRVKSSVDQIFIVLNSYRGQQFDSIPFASIRIYEGTPTRVDDVLAGYNIAKDSTFNNKVSMVLGKLYRHKDSWKFNAIGEPTNDRTLDGIISTIQKTYL